MGYFHFLTGIILLFIIKEFGSSECKEPDAGPVFLLEPPSNVLIYSHVGKTIACSAHGQPAPAMSWERANGLPLPLDSKYIRVHANNSLHILPFVGPLNSTVHRTAYRCVARNLFGEVVSRSVHIKTVKTESYGEYDVYTQNVWVMRGNTAVFTCDIRPSFVRPFVNVHSWFVDFEEITSGGRYLMIDSTLHLFNITQADHLKKVKCVTVNFLNDNSRKSSRRVATLFVVDPVLTAPAIEYKSERIISKFGLPVVIPCVAQAFPLASYSWSKNGNPITESTSLTASNGYLRILSANVNDSGIYLCNASNMHGSTAVSTKLLVTKMLLVEIFPKSQKRDANLPADMLCNVSGSPYSQVVWYKDGSLLTFNNNIRKLSDFHIRIQSVSRKDAGMYQCLVSSSYDNVQASSQLQLGVSEPVFHDKSEALYLHRGDSVSLTCKVYGNPPPSVHWMLADALLLPTNDSQRIKVGQYMTSEGDIVSHVNISSLAISDGGTYICTANNTIGSAQQPQQLNIYGVPVVRAMENQTAVSNKIFTLKCFVSGYPISTVSWLRGNRILRGDHRASYTGLGKLTINPVSVSDEGWYTCAAVNEDGQGSNNSLYLSVITEPKLVPLYFPALTEGDSHIALCQTKGGDKPIQLSWYKNGQLIASNSFPFLIVKQNTDSSSTLSFSSISTTDVGNYTCVASNKAGVVSTTAQLHQVNVRPYWLVQPKDSEAILEDTKEILCRGSGSPPPTVIWKEAIDSNPQTYQTINNKNDSRQQVLDNGSLFITNITFADAKQYICQISNGISPDISQIIRLTVNAPVKYTKTTDTIVSLVGQEVTLICNAVGDLPIHTVWAAKRQGETDWVQLDTLTSSRLNLMTEKTASGQKTMLTVSSLLRADNGEYRCISTNDFGEAHRRIQLIVKEAPAAVKNLTAIKIKSREVVLSWILPDNGNSAITEYILQFLPIKEDQEFTPQHAIINSTAQKILTDLQPATLYRILVIAVNAVGKSKPSKEVEVTTAEEAPSGPPADIALETLSDTSLLITWLPPESNLLNGKLVGYKIGFKSKNSSDDYMYAMLHSASADNFKLVNLFPNVCYLVTVAAFNSKGLGPPSVPAEACTFEDIPSKAPDGLSLETYNRSVTVKWEAIHLPHFYGGILGYKVFIHQANAHQDEREQHMKISKLTEVTFQDLDVYTSYSIQVLAYSDKGNGPRSSPAFTMTAPAPPGEPLSVSAHAINSSCVLVSWLKPNRTNGVLQKYAVTVYSGSKYLKQITINQSATQHHVVNGFTQDLAYGFTVKAKNFGTEYGLESDLITATPLSNATPAIATMEQRISVEYHQSFLMPCFAFGDPKPTVDWTKAGSSHMSLDHFKVIENNSLYIDTVYKKDSGYYTCTATNLHGKTTATFLLDVFDDIEIGLPSAPILSIDSILSSSIQVSWISTGNGGSALTGWSLEISESGKWKTIDLPQSRRSYRFLQLPCSQSFDIRIRGVNMEGSSVYSNAVSATTLGSKPTALTDGKILSSLSNTSMLVDFNQWSDNGCPITIFRITYGKLGDDRRSMLGPITSSLQSVAINELLPGTSYNIVVTAYNTAGSTSVYLNATTLAADGSTVAQSQEDNGDGATTHFNKWISAIPISILVSLIILAVVIGCCFLKKRKMHMFGYKGGNKSRKSIFSSISDHKAHRPISRQFDIPRENYSGDSGVWLLNHPITNLSADHADADKEQCNYETCTPTLSFIRAKLSKETDYLTDIHRDTKENCRYCGDQTLAQYGGESPIHLPAVPHGYHSLLTNRVYSSEALRHVGRTDEYRPNTTMLHNTETSRKIGRYSSCMSSMATVSSNQEELITAYHNSKISPPGPILFESPRPYTSSVSPESSIATESGIRMFTQSPPKPEESRQAVCEVPIYSTTLPSEFEPAKDQVVELKPANFKRIRRRPYRKKQKRSHSQWKFRDAGEDISTNSDECNYPPCIPYHSSSLSSKSDGGYGTKSKSIDDSFKAKSHKRSEGGEFGEEEEKMSLVQMAHGAGETTPPSSQSNLATDLDGESPVAGNLK